MGKFESEQTFATDLKYHVTQAEIELEVQEINAAVEDMGRFSVLYDRYYVRIFRFVYQRIGDEDVTADVTSRVFLNAMLHLKSYKHKGYPFASWLYRIARNEVNQEFRKERSDRNFQAQWTDFQDLCSEVNELADEIHLKALATALKKLKPADLEVIEMRFFEKRSFKEIGDILNVTENNAKVKMFRIIRRLKKYMNL
jgi:RNA polymerase sigma-70 factor (ECF subfamily)